MYKYSTNTAWSDEDECFVATVPEFPYLSGFGETPEEAVVDIQGVLETVIDAMVADGTSPPEPKKLVHQNFSGQTRLRLPKSLHAKLANDAEEDNVSLNTYMVSLLSQEHSVAQVYKETIRDLEAIITRQQEKMSSMFIQEHVGEDSGDGASGQFVSSECQGQKPLLRLVR
jgi:predicted RNase H-like HicB family nuclease